jgi:lysophospholipase L1-like esterase
MKIRVLVLAALLAFLPAFSQAQLKPGDGVAISGDSITEQKLYSVFIQDYLLMCQPAPDLHTAQFGWSGEVAPGFLNRMANDVLWFKPNVATTCYGMNDGGYSPMTNDKARRYRDTHTAIVQQFKKAGTRVIIVGSPGCVDFDFFRQSREAADMYNKTLGALRDIAREVAQEEQVIFANVFDAMISAMTNAKAKYGSKYHLAGPDGFHPAPNGHLVMAYAFLKAMGCDGNIGSITIDLAGNKAQATDGHKVLSSNGGVVEIESSRYPFCFYGNPASPDATAGVIEFFPFNQDLNRLTLTVAGGKGKLKVTWGKTSKTFDAEQLAKGINLAAEFIDNPFSEPFRQVEQAIRQQQNYETTLHKQLLNGLGTYRRHLPDEEQAIQRLAAKSIEKQQQLSAASRAAVKPVKHTIKVEAE